MTSGWDFIFISPVTTLPTVDCAIDISIPTDENVLAGGGMQPYLSGLSLVICFGEHDANDNNKSNTHINRNICFFIILSRPP